MNWSPLSCLTLMKMLLYRLHPGCFRSVMDAVHGEASLRFSYGSCPLCTGESRVSSFCHHLKCWFWRMDPCRACDWMSLRTVQDYKLSDKEEQGEPDKQIGSLRLGTVQSSWTSKSILHFNDVVCPGVDQRHLFESQEASWPSPTTRSQWAWLTVI